MGASLGTYYCRKYLFYHCIIMPGPTTEFWWFLLIGTITALTLGLGLIGLLLVNERTRSRLQQEKYDLVEKSERKYGDLFENVSDLIYIHSLSGIITSINPTVTALLGFATQEVIGKPISTFLVSGTGNKIGAYLKE